VKQDTDFWAGGEFADKLGEDSWYVGATFVKENAYTTDSTDGLTSEFLGEMRFTVCVSGHEVRYWIAISRFRFPLVFFAVTPEDEN
jgi:hypothetical protein